MSLDSSSSSSSKETNTEQALLMNQLDETTQLHSAEISNDNEESGGVSLSPLDDNLRLMDTGLKLVKPAACNLTYLEDAGAELPTLLGLECKRTGSVFLPFSGEQAERLFNAYNDHDDHDEDKRPLHTSIDATEVNFKNPAWNERLETLVRRLAKTFDCKIPIRARLERLIALKKGSIPSRSSPHILNPFFYRIRLS